jgi:hypothetical protein
MNAQNAEFCTIYGAVPGSFTPLKWSLVPPDSKEYYILNIESPDSQTDTMIMIMIQSETEK